MRVWALSFLWSVAVLLNGCMGVTAKLPSSFEYAPLVRKIDARVGVYFPPPVRGYVCVTPLVRFPVGEASAGRLRQAFAALFSEVRELGDWPPWRGSHLDLDGVVEVDRIGMTVVIGDDSGTKPDVVKATYRACFYSTESTQVSCVASESENKHFRGLGECVPQLDRCLTEQVDTAMRDAMARLVLSLENDPQVRAWAARLTDERERR